MLPEWRGQRRLSDFFPSWELGAREILLTVDNRKWARVQNAPRPRRDAIGVVSAKSDKAVVVNFRAKRDYLDATSLFST